MYLALLIKSNNYLNFASASIENEVISTAEESDSIIYLPDHDAKIAELPAQLHRHDVGVERARRLRVNRITDALHDKRLHDDGVIGRTQEGPAGNEQEALNVDGRLNASLMCARGIERSGAPSHEV